MQRTGNTRTMVMPTLVLPTSGSVAGQYMFTEIDPFSGITNFPRQPSQTTSIYQQSGPNEGASDQQHGEPARKRRLTLDQTKSLECSFATDSKLEPERKKRLAVELGLQPRQVAIWYQNRRARTKTKHLEEKYDALYTEYQGVLERNRKLEAEIITLKKQLGLQEKFTPGGPKDVKPSTEKPQEESMSTNVKENANQAALLSMNQKAKVFIECNLKQQTSVDTEVDSNNTTCATTSAHNGLAHNVDSPASQCTSYLQETDVVVEHTASGTKEVVSYNIAQLGAHCELDCLVPNYPLSPHNHFHDQQQQQHQLLQQLQHHYNSSLSQFVGDIGLAETQENVGLPTTQLAPVYMNDNFFDDYRFKLEDETACLYFDLATTEV